MVGDISYYHPLPVFRADSPHHTGLDPVGSLYKGPSEF